MSLLFSPNLNIFFKELPFPKRIEKMKSLGFTHVEFWGWWDEDVEAIAEATHQTGIQVAAFCTKFISLVDKAQRQNYLHGLGKTLDVAKKLNCRTLISQVGNELSGISREEQKVSLIEGLSAAVPLLEKANVTLTIEPLNLLVDHPGYFLARSDEAFDIVRKVGSSHVKVLFDIYHQQVTEGNLINNIHAGSDLIGHYHVADHPGRCEIGCGEINYTNVFQAIEKTGYQGAIGIELFPKHVSDESALDGVKRFA